METKRHQHNIWNFSFYDTKKLNLNTEIVIILFGGGKTAFFFLRAIEHTGTLYGGGIAFFSESHWNIQVHSMGRKSRVFYVSEGEMNIVHEKAVCCNTRYTILRETGKPWHQVMLLWKRKDRKIFLLDTASWQKVCLLPNCLVMREFRFDELCGLRQTALLWPIYTPFTVLQRLIEFTYVRILTFLQPCIWEYMVTHTEGGT